MHIGEIITVPARRDIVVLYAVGARKDILNMWEVYALLARLHLLP